MVYRPIVPIEKLAHEQRMRHVDEMRWRRTYEHEGYRASSEALGRAEETAGLRHRLALWRFVAVFQFLALLMVLAERTMR